MNLWSLYTCSDCRKMHDFQGYFSRTFQDLKLSRKKIQDFPGGVGTLARSSYIKLTCVHSKRRCCICRYITAENVCFNTVRYCRRRRTYATSLTECASVTDISQSGTRWLNTKASTSHGNPRFTHSTSIGNGGTRFKTRQQN